MQKLRIIARLDIKGENLIKGIHLEGLRVIGPPEEYAKRYYEEGVDELLYMDSVASLYGRNNLRKIVERTSKDIFIPLTVGGGVRTLDDVRDLLRSGADKVAVNTAAVKRPELITEISRKYGSQCMVLSIEAKMIGPNTWEVYTDNGRERTGLEVIDWAVRGVELGAGEVLVTSVDREGTRKGFDLDLLKSITQAVDVPVIASGGMGSNHDLVELVRHADVSAIAMADIIHYQRSSIGSIKSHALSSGIMVRQND